MKKSTACEVLRVRVAPECAAFVKRCAKSDGRTVSGWLRQAIEAMSREREARK